MRGARRAGDHRPGVLPVVLDHVEDGALGVQQPWELRSHGEAHVAGVAQVVPKRRRQTRQHLSRHGRGVHLVLPLAPGLDLARELVHHVFGVLLLLPRLALFLPVEQRLQGVRDRLRELVAHGRVQRLRLRGIGGSGRFPAAFAAAAAVAVRGR